MKQKNNLFQLFCKHENSSWYKKETMFHALNGERKYKICDDCGKLVDQFYKAHVNENFV